MIYIIVGLLLILCAFIELIEDSKRFSVIALLFFSTVLILFAGLRDGVGTDWKAYYNFYVRTTQKVELAYSGLNNLFSSFGLPYNAFLVVTNLISVGLIARFLFSHSRFYLLGVLLFYSNLYLYYNFSGMRQSLAIAVTCWSFTYAKNRKIFVFLLLVSLATLFHSSAFIFVFAYFIPRSKMTYSVVFWAIIGFIILYYSLDAVSHFLTLYTGNNADYYVNVIEKPESLLSLFIIGILVRSVPLIVLYVFRNSIYGSDTMIYMLNIYLFGYALYLTTYVISPDIGVRLSSYFLIYEIAIVGLLLSLLKVKRTKFIIMYVFSLISLYRLYGYSQSSYYDYAFIF